MENKKTASGKGKFPVAGSLKRSKRQEDYTADPQYCQHENGGQAMQKILISADEFERAYHIKQRARVCLIAAEIKKQTGRTLNLKAKIRDAGISYNMLAIKTGFTKPSITAWANNRRCPYAYCLPILAEALGCTIEDLFLPPEEVQE